MNSSFDTFGVKALTDLTLSAQQVYQHLISPYNSNTKSAVLLWEYRNWSQHCKLSNMNGKILQNCLKWKYRIYLGEFSNASFVVFWAERFKVSDSEQLSVDESLLLNNSYWRV